LQLPIAVSSTRLALLERDRFAFFLFSLAHVQTKEIFQDACRNHYGACACPMVFFGEEFWRSSGVFELVEKTSKGKIYHDLLLCTDNQDAIVKHFIKYREESKLPVVTEEMLRAEFWKKTPKARVISRKLTDARLKEVAMRKYPQ
jgi:hypothetical protein